MQLRAAQQQQQKEVQYIIVICHNTTHPLQIAQFLSGLSSQHSRSADRIIKTAAVIHVPTPVMAPNKYDAASSKAAPIPATEETVKPKKALSQDELNRRAFVKCA